ncbi:hypothetical protein Tdes44962_MAKER00071 [Teratosphaeria destructans]|uniref:Uncharacterized protein n=1 Tax=Teratosphaeria destructans TaxID=418781 RepID=A0A9W7T3C0_9PEZI|nr:hypothetical protein Tdes44962_MAKER00071 [Teratosphaeria destructans]
MPPLHSEFEDMLDSDDEMPELVDMTGDDYQGDTIHTRPRMNSSPSPAPQVQRLKPAELEDIHMHDALIDRQDNVGTDQEQHGGSHEEDRGMAISNKESGRGHGRGSLQPQCDDSNSDLTSTTETESVEADLENIGREITTMSCAERRAAFKRVFGNKTVCLADIDEVYTYVCSSVFDTGDQPEEMLSELFEAYVDQVTFHVKLWPNYDTALKQFHSDPQRLQDCGELRLDKTERERLSRLDWDEWEMRHVMLVISSPFRGGLIEVRLTAVPTHHRIGCKAHATAKVVLMGRPYLNLTEFVRDTCDEINAAKALTYGTNGFQLADLDELARMFLFEPPWWAV